MRNQSAIFVFAIMFVGMSALVFAWNGMFVPADPDADCPGNLCRAYRVFSEFQTLVGAGMAILAAWLAAQPVWKQLNKMNIQQDIMSRDIIERRLNSIEANYRYLDTKLTTLLQDIWATIYYPYDDEADYDPQSVNPVWAHDLEHRVYLIVADLGKHQASKGDTVKIEAARREVIKALNGLSACLNSISAPSRSVGDWEISDEQRSQLVVEEQKARSVFDKIARDVDAARTAFNRVAVAEIDRIRERIREIDDHLLRAHDD